MEQTDWKPIKEFQERIKEVEENIDEKLKRAINEIFQRIENVIWKINNPKYMVALKVNKTNVHQNGIITKQYRKSG